MPRKLLIYTVEVDGKPTLAFAGHAREAAEICKEEWFRNDLTGLTSSGAPLCLSGSTFRSRIANASEMAIYQEAAKEAKASEGILLVYLIELDGMPR